MFLKIITVNSMSILVSGDSRAVDLAALVATAMGNSDYYTVKECAKASRNIGKIQYYTLLELEQNDYDVVIFLAGTCDVTKKRYNQGQREIYYPHPNEATCRAVVSVRLSEMMRKCHDFFPQTKFILCTLYGMDLGIFNHVNQDDPKQQLLNRSIKLLKGDIKYINKLYDVPTINLHTVFHRNRYNKNRSGKKTSGPSRFVCQYKKKMRDGCHPTTDYQKVIASRIATVVKSLLPIPLAIEFDPEMEDNLWEMEEENDEDPEWDGVMDRLRQIYLG